MNAIAFDTHTIARRYKAAGFTEAQIEAMVDTARESASLPDLSHLGTKADLMELRVATKADFAELRQQIAETNVRLILAVLAISGFFNGLLFFLLRR